MTLPASGPISLSQVNTELLITPSTTTITMNDSGVRFLTGTSAGTTDSMQQLLGKSYVIAANSGILTSGSSYALPQTSGATIKVLAIAGGGGGGGGSGRSSFSGFFTGGGGGGDGGNAYTTVSVTPGQTVYFSIGAAGGAGSARDGIYSSGSNGGSGTTTTITVNSSNVAVATGGGGGTVSYYDSIPGGSAGGVSAGSALVTPVAGQNAPDGTQTGGYGGNGYSINTSVGATTILTLGSTAAGAAGPGGGPATTGVAYGGGGGGGGTCQSDRGGQQNGAQIAAGGYQGAVFIWWGY
jgi:hypothetical protein